MHKVTISSKETDTEVNNNYEALIFISMPADNSSTMECILLGNNTDEAITDAMVKPSCYMRSIRWRTSSLRAISWLSSHHYLTPTLQTS